MKNKALVINLLLILCVLSFGLVTTALADVGEGEWFTSYRVEDPNTGELMVEVENRKIAEELSEALLERFGDQVLIAP